MKILLDHNLDRRLCAALDVHECRTTQAEGWADLTNGELLTVAEQNGFEILLTADSNIRKQQNLANRKIGIVVLRAHNNRLTTHLEMVRNVLDTLQTSKFGEVLEVFHPQMKTK